MENTEGKMNKRHRDREMKKQGDDDLCELLFLVQLVERANMLLN